MNRDNAENQEFRMQGTSKRKTSPNPSILFTDYREQIVSYQKENDGQKLFNYQQMDTYNKTRRYRLSRKLYEQQQRSQSVLNTTKFNGTQNQSAENDTNLYQRIGDDLLREENGNSDQDHKLNVGISNQYKEARPSVILPTRRNTSDEMDTKELELNRTQTYQQQTNDAPFSRLQIQSDQIYRSEKQSSKKKHHHHLIYQSVKQKGNCELKLPNYYLDGSPPIRFDQLNSDNQSLESQSNIEMVQLEHTNVNKYQHKDSVFNQKQKTNIFVNEDVSQNITTKDVNQEATQNSLNIHSSKNQKSTGQDQQQNQTDNETILNEAEEQTDLISTKLDNQYISKQYNNSLQGQSTRFETSKYSENGFDPNALTLDESSTTKKDPAQQIMMNKNELRFDQPSNTYEKILELDSLYATVSKINGRGSLSIQDYQQNEEEQKNSDISVNQQLKKRSEQPQTNGNNYQTKQSKISQLMNKTFQKTSKTYFMPNLSPEIQSWLNLPKNKVTFVQLQELKSYTAHIYLHSGRNLPSSDPDGLSDPFVKVHFQGQSATSIVREDSLIPQWHQTLVIDDLLLPEIEDNQNAPLNYLYIFDEDEHQNEFLGMTTLQVVFATKWDRNMKWYKCRNFLGESTGEVLVSVVLYEERKNIPKLTMSSQSDEKMFMKLPRDLYPSRKLARFEILLWGLRHLKVKCKALSLKVTIAGTQLVTSPQPLTTRGIKKRSWLNFSIQDQAQAIILPIPLEDVFMPSFMVMMQDEKKRTLAAYQHDGNIGKFQDISVQNEYDFQTVSDDVEQKLLTKDDGENLEDEEIELKKKDWWTRYYASLEETVQDQDVFPFVVFEKALENEGYFSGFNDILLKLPLMGETRSKLKKRRNFTEQGSLKCAIRWRFLDEQSADESNLMMSEEVCSPEIITRFLTDPMPKFGRHLKIRIYIIEAQNLKTAKKSIPDPYLGFKFGDQVPVLFTDDFLPNNTNPQFGFLYQQDILIPEDNFVEILVYDWNKIRKDELLGSTIIDLEQRYYNGINGRCGIPFRYSQETWRDHLTPPELLERICQVNNIETPLWNKQQIVQILGTQYCPGSKLDDRQKKSLMKEAKVFLKQEDILRRDLPVYCKINSTELVAYQGQLSSIEFSENISIENQEMKSLYEQTFTKSTSMWNSLFSTKKSQSTTITSGMKSKITNSTSKYSQNSQIKRNQLPEDLKDQYQLALDIIHFYLPNKIESFKLVPEHIEMRPLFHPDSEETPIGTLSLWIDLFPGEVNPLPKPINILPRKPVNSELRVIIYDIYNIVSSEKKPDVYIEACIPGVLPAQQSRTDVHKNVDDSTAKFNYRLVFSNLMYFDIDNKFEVGTKKIEPQLQIDMIDKNIIGKEKLGTLILPLTNVPYLGNTINSARFLNLENATQFFNVFDISGSPHEGKSGYWPIMNKFNQVTGVIHMEFQSYTKEQAEKYVGKEGNDPGPSNQNPMLEKPLRPKHRLKKLMKSLVVILPLISIIIIVLKFVL